MVPSPLPNGAVYQVRFIHVDSKKYIVRLVVLFGLVFTPAVFAQGYTIGPAPSWVKPAQIPDSDKLSQQNNSDGEAYLLVDFQWQVGESQHSQYRHIVTKALNTTGVSEASQISIDFDPVYETLVLAHDQYSTRWPYYRQDRPHTDQSDTA